MPLKKKKESVLSNDIKASWDVLNDVKAELRDVQKKLSHYAQQEESETGNLQSASINNRHSHAPSYKTNEFLANYRQTQSFNNFASPKKYDHIMKDNLRERLFEYSSNNTIQAGDPSLLMPHQHRHASSSSKYNFDIPSLLSLNNDYDKLLEENYMELKMKCLNDLNIHESESKYQQKLADELSALRSRKQQRQHLTKVDIKVPSNTKPRRSDSTRHIANGSAISQLIQKNFSSSETRLDNKHDYIRNGSSSKSSHKLGMENNSNRLNQQNIPPSTPTGAPITKRTLHRDDDLLPFSHNSPSDLIYNTKFSSSKTKFANGSNITKRHLAGATNTPNNYEDIVSLYGSGSMLKSKNNVESSKDAMNSNSGEKPNRKIAVLTNSNYKYKPGGAEKQNNDYEEFMVDPKSQSSAAFNSKNDKEQLERITKKQKKNESESLGNFESTSFNQNFYMSGKAGNVNQKESSSKLGAVGSGGSGGGSSGATSGIITASSWRIGEALVQKQLKQHLRQQQQQQQGTVKMDRMNILNSMKLGDNSEEHGAVQMLKKNKDKKLINDEDRRASSSNHSPNIKLKRTDCHLIQKNLLPGSQSATALSPNLGSNGYKPGSSSSGGSKSTKPYDVNDVHRYMQSKKTKRMYETRSEKEKQKREDEERKKKLAELYRKQRAQTASANSGTTSLDNNNHGGSTQMRTKSMKLTKSDSLSSNEYHEGGVLNSNPSKLTSSSQGGAGSFNSAAGNSGVSGSAKSNKLFEQDMSKILLDKITHLLNDNDKLVEKQRKHLHVTKFNNQKVLSQVSSKRVDFIDPTKDKQHVEYEENDYCEDEVDQEDDCSDSETNENIKIEDNFYPTNNSSKNHSASNNNNHNNTNESSLNYSASSTLTPSAFHNARGDNVAKKSRNLSNEDLSYNTGQQHPQLYKHDRLKKICTMALDLQTKLQQTKLKLFGMNPNDDTMIYYDKNSGETDYPGSSSSHQNRGNKLSHQQSLEYKDEVFNSENLISFEKVFKQQVKEQQEKQHHHEHGSSAYMESHKYGFNRSHSPLPGTVDFRSRIGRITQDQAARKIQRAWRAYAVRRHHSRHQPRYYRYEAQKSLDMPRGQSSREIQKHMHELKAKQAATNSAKYATSVEFRGGNPSGTNDDYNFINIFKKRAGTLQTSSQSVPSQSTRHKLGKTSSMHSEKPTQKQHISADIYEDDYSEDFTATRATKKEVKLTQPELNKSSISTVSSSSSSSDSTSLSKYMILSKKTTLSHDTVSMKKPQSSATKNNNQHAVSVSASIDSTNHQNTNNNDENESLSSNESISSKVSSNSSSSHSTTLSLMSNTNNKSGNKSKILITPPASAGNHVSLSSRTNRNNDSKSGLKESSLKFLKRNKIIPSDDPQAQKELRYSPTSLEYLLKAGINYLDTLNTSAVQLEELDKIRCIGLAQQDTVALAHLIKDQQIAAAGPSNHHHNKQQSDGHEPTTNKKVSAVSKSYDTSDFESTEETYESRMHRIKSERSASARPTRATTQATGSKQSGNNPRAVSLSSTFSSSSYSDSNDNTETDTHNVHTAASTRRSLAIKSSHQQDDQDVSIINTISEINSEKKSTTGDEEDGELEKSFRQLLPSESHLKKNKLESRGDHSLLYMNDMSQTSFSQLEPSQPSVRISFEDDSFKKFTGEIVKKYMQEEEMRSKHQAHLLKLREKALVDKTTTELTWLEQMKKKVQDKGEDEKMPSILKKEKGIMQKLKEEQENINQMKEVQRKATENRLKILSQHSEVIKWCQNKLKKQSHHPSAGHGTNHSMNIETSLKDGASSAAAVAFASATTSAKDSAHHHDSDVTSTNADENDVDNQTANQLDESTINQSLIESKIMKQVKQHLNSEKYLTEREKKLRLRRKHAEEIIAWKKKLDDEELQVREIEKKANLVLHSKTQQAAGSKAGATTEAQVTAKPTKAGTPTAASKDEPTKSAAKTKSSVVADHSYSESFIPTNIDKTETIKTTLKTGTTTGSNDSSSVQSSTRSNSASSTSTSKYTESIKTRIDTTKVHDSDDSSIKTNLDEIIETMNNIEEDINDNSFDTTTANTKRTRDHTAKTIETDNISSSTSASTTTTSSANTAVDLEKKVKQLKSELNEKKSEAEKLRSTLKAKEKNKLKEKEEFLRKKISSYDNLIDKIKTALDVEQNQLNIKNKEDQIEKAKRKKLKSTSTIATEQFEEETHSEEEITDKTDKTNEFSVTEDVKQASEKSEKNDISETSRIKTELPDQSIQDNDETETDIKTQEIVTESKMKSISEASETSTTTSESSKPQFVESVEVKKKTPIASDASSNKSSGSSTSNHADSSNKYDDDDFIATTTETNKSSDSKKDENSVHAGAIRKQRAESFDDDKSTVSEISEEIMVNMSVDNRSARSKVIDQDSQASQIKDDSTETNDTSSSTDTQILLLNRTPRGPGQGQGLEDTETNVKTQTDVDKEHDTDVEDGEGVGDVEESVSHATTKSIGTKVERENQKQNGRLVDSIEETILGETITEMIKVRENKILKLEKTLSDNEDESADAEVNEIESKELGSTLEDSDGLEDAQNDLKIYIPSINLDEDQFDDNKPSTFRSSGVKEKLVQLKIPYRKEKIDKLTDMVISDYFWQRLSENRTVLVEDAALSELMGDPDLSEYFKSDREAVVGADAKAEEDVAQIELNFKRMLLDLVGETLHDLYLEKYEEPTCVSNFFPGIKNSLKKHHFKSIIRGPQSQEEAQKMIKKKINKLLKLAVSTESFLDTKPEINAKSKWRTHKKLDLVDSLLDTEMREQEHEWSNYELEEYEAKILISNTIFDMILKDTVDCFQLNMLRKLERQESS